MAYETDLLEFGDLFDGSAEISRTVDALKHEARPNSRRSRRWAARSRRSSQGYMKRQLVESNTRRLEAIERGEQIVVGVNMFTDDRPVAADGGRRRDPETVGRGRGGADRAPEGLARERATLRASSGVGALRAAAKSGQNIMPASIEAAKAGVTTGEWGAALRAEFGEYRAPTGVRSTARQEAGGPRRVARRSAARFAEARQAAEIRDRQAGARRPFQRRRADRGARDRRRHGRRLRRHSLDAGRDRRARQDGRPCVGLSILSGSHVAMTREVLALMKRRAWPTSRSSSAASFRPRTPRR